MHRCWVAVLLILAAAPIAAQKRLEVVGRFGELDGALTFVSIRQAVAGGGLIYVAQDADRTIRVLNREGTLVREIGRAGSGPGEFRSVSEIALIGDTLVAYDASAGRVTRMDTAGSVLGTDAARIQMAETGGTAWFPMYLGAEGEIVYFHSTLGQADEWVEVVLIRDGAVVDSLSSIPIRDRSVVVGNANGYSATTRIAHRGARFDMSPDGKHLFVVDSRGSHLVALRTSVASGAVDSLTIPLPDVAVPEAWSDSINSRFNERFSQLSPERAEQMRRAYVLPTSVPGAAEVTVTIESELWIKHPDFTGRATEWTVVDWEAGTMRSVIGPPRVEILARDGDDIWGTTYDDFGVSYLLLLQIG